ncbi:ATP-binding protein [Thermodesulfobacteriota bacterium]
MILKKYLISILSLMFIAIISIVFFSIRTNREVHNAIKSEFIKDLQQISRGSVMAIENDIFSVKRTLKQTGEALKEFDFDIKNPQTLSHIDNIYNGVDFISINDLGYLDKNGILKYNIAAPQIIGMDFSFRKYYKRIKSQNDPSFLDAQFITFKGANKDDKGLIFAMGVFEDDEKEKPRFKGVVILTSELKSFIEEYLKTLTVGDNGYMWFFESTGEVIYHPKVSKGDSYQPVKNPILETDSFKNTVKNIAENNLLTSSYIEEGEEYLYSATPVTIGTDKWFFVASIPEKEISGLLTKYSKSYLLTSLAVFAVIIFGFFLIFIFYLRNRNLTQAVDIQKYQLEYARSLNEELDSIITTMAHDLRTPLTSVMGFSQQVLEKSLRGPLDEKDSQNLSKVFFSANFMKDLIDSLLEYAKIGRSRNIIEDISLKDLFEEIKVQLHYNIESRDAVVNIPDKMPTIKADRIKTMQLFSNIISNAIKFVPENKVPLVDISFKEEGNHCIIYITDNGIGIDENSLDKIFKIFYRENTMDTQGTGVGLAIVKKIVEEIGCRISVKSKKGEGSTFIVSCGK